MESKPKPTIVTVTGIRPDFIRMSAVFERFDREFNHILIHSGQHYNTLLSDVMFSDLNIRKPDYNLGIGGVGKEHYHQTADLTVSLITLLKEKNIKPQWIVFLGDSNTVSVAPSLRKEGYNIAHIEAGMRSYDRNMLEETNRVVCDHCSDLLFVYHENYKTKLLAEGIPERKIFVVGNTITEVATKRRGELFTHTQGPTDPVLVDIHRPENFKSKIRLKKIVDYCEELHVRYNRPIEWINFPRTESFLDEFGITFKNIKKIPLMSYKEYTKKMWESWLLISDSGTAQEEAPIFKTKCLVPREFTERPESYSAGCSKYLNLHHPFSREMFHWLRRKKPRKPDVRWLGTGKTADKITKILKEHCE